MLGAEKGIDCLLNCIGASVYSNKKVVVSLGSRHEPLVTTLTVMIPSL